MLRPCEVIEAYHAHLLGTPHMQLIDRSHQSEQHPVVARDDGGRWLGKPQQVEPGPVPGINRLIPDPQVLGPNSKIPLLHRLAKTVQTIRVWRMAQIAGNKGDSIVSQIDQVPGCAVSRILVVRGYTGIGDALRNPIDEYDWKAASDKAVISSSSV